MAVCSCHHFCSEHDARVAVCSCHNFLSFSNARFGLRTVPWALGRGLETTGLWDAVKRKSSGTSRGPCSREMRLQNPPRFLSSRLSCLDLDSQVQRLHTLSIHLRDVAECPNAIAHSGAIAFGRDCIRALESSVTSALRRLRSSEFRRGRSAFQPKLPFQSHTSITYSRI